MDTIQAEARILSVTDDASWKYSIEADIPAFDGDRSYRYLAWAKKQGPPPRQGATVLATFEAYQRAKYYVTRGDIEDGPVDGSEKHYHVTWNMIAAEPIEATNGAGVGGTTRAAPAAPVRATSHGSPASGATYLPAPTPDERLTRELQKFRREIEGVNDRKAISDILAMAEPGTYTLAGLIEDAEKLATWYNSRVAARCDSPLVQAAQEAGAVVANVTAADWVPPLKNKAELTTWVAERGWSKATISDVLQGAGYASSAAYLQADGNSVQGLAELLMAQLNW